MRSCSGCSRTRLSPITTAIQSTTTVHSERRINLTNSGRVTEHHEHFRLSVSFFPLSQKENETRRRASLIIKRVSEEDLSKEYTCKLEVPAHEYMVATIRLKQTRKYICFAHQIWKTDLNLFSSNYLSLSFLFQLSLHLHPTFPWQSASSALCSSSLSRHLSVSSSKLKSRFSFAILLAAAKASQVLSCFPAFSLCQSFMKPAFDLSSSSWIPLF